MVCFNANIKYAYYFFLLTWKNLKRYIILCKATDMHESVNDKNGNDGSNDYTFIVVLCTSLQDARVPYVFTE